MNRPTLADLADRRAPSLHRTLPTWARERLEDGRIEWRIYVPHSGAAIFTRLTVPTATSRSDIARQIREHRRVLWGRDKMIPPPVANPDKRINMGLQHADADEDMSATPDAGLHPAPDDVAAPPQPASAPTLPAADDSATDPESSTPSNTDASPLTFTEALVDPVEVAHAPDQSLADEPSSLVTEVTPPGAAVAAAPAETAAEQVESMPAATLPEADTKADPFRGAPDGQGSLF